MPFRSIFLLICLLGSGASLFAEIGLQLSPCFLCQLQRSLYLLLTIPALIGLQGLSRRCAAIMLTFGLLVASVHTLIQLGILKDRCGATVSVGSKEEYRALLLQKPSGCAKQSWRLGKIPASMFNIWIYLGLFLVLVFKKEEDYFSRNFLSLSSKS